MLKKLKRELIAITMALAGLVLVAALGSTFVANYTSQHAMTDQLLSRTLAQGVSTDVAPSLEGGDTGSILTMVFDISRNGTVLVRANSYVDISQDALYSIINEVLQSPKDSGQSSDYAIAWMRVEKDYGFRMALADTYARDQALKRQAVADVLIVCASLGVLYLIVRRLADISLRPVEAAWEQQRRFVSDASHELKTPLAVILANTQILLGEKGLDDDARRWVKSTDDEASHMKSLVEDLLTLARSDEEAASGLGGAHLARTDVDLTSLLDGCALEFDAVAFERGCELVCDLAPNVHVSADAAQLERALRTLIDNATKYANKGSVVRVGLVGGAASQKGAGHATVRVNNRGEVISGEAQVHLFDRFYRTDDARERQAEGGFGLGLAIAKSIVEAHGGTISVSSTEAEGTTFTVTL